MNVSNLLPSNLKNTRWDQFFKAVWSYLQDFKNVKISKLKNKFNPEEAISSDLDNLKDLLQRKGYTLIEANGYTSSLEYHKRRALSIPTEILWHTSKKSYNSILKSFWFLGTTYSLAYSLTNEYLPIAEYDTNANTFIEYLMLDQESDIIYYYNGITPVPNPPIETNLPEAFLDDDVNFGTLDYAISYLGSNHFLLNYKFYVVEDKDVFISYNTAKSLYETVLQAHRLKEVPHYRPELNIYVNNTNTIQIKSYSTYDKDQTKNSNIQSLFSSSGNLNLLTSIKIGVGKYVNINNSITNVSQPIGEFLITQFNVSNQNVYTITLEYKISEYGKLLDKDNNSINYFSELLFLYESTNIMYCTFPTIYFYEKMYSSLKINVII